MGIHTESTRYHRPVARGSLTRWILSLAVGLALLTASSASAQSKSLWNFDGVFVKDYSPRDMVFINETLQLDDAQQIICEALLEDYMAAFDIGVQELRAELGKQVAGIDPNRARDHDQIRRLVFAPVRDWQKQKKILAASFEADLKSQLAPQQLDLWPSLERRLRREHTLRKGVLSMEQTDLFRVMREMDLSRAEREQLSPFMTEYELELDAALIKRNKFLEESGEQMAQALDAKDFTAYRAMADRKVKLHVGVRDVNDRHAHAISEALGPAMGGLFMQTVLEQAFPTAYRRTQFERTLRAAMQLPDLDEGTKAALDVINAEFGREMAQFRSELVELIRSSDPRLEMYRREKDVARREGRPAQPNKDPVRDKIRTRSRIENRYRTDLNAILTPEQMAMLPGGGASAVGAAGADAKQQRRRMDADQEREMKRRRMEERRRRSEGGLRDDDDS